MKYTDLAKYWQAFLHWKGWRAFSRWSGWRRIFAIPFAAAMVLGVVCGAGLVWVFSNGLDQWPPAYFLYALSAYTLTALCVKLPTFLRRSKSWLGRHPKLLSLLKNENLKFSLELYFEQFINFAYGIFKICTGVVVGSAWIGADGIYNFTQALIQLFQILRRKRGGSLLSQWKSYRFCGVLILLMHLTLTGIVFQMLNWKRVEEQGEIMVIATAAFAFYKLLSSFIDLARDRKHKHPIDSSVRMLELSQAIFSLFSLQASMLHTFGTGEDWESWLNAGSGCTACLLVAAMGVYMIRRGNREIKEIQESEHGK